MSNETREFNRPKEFARAYKTTNLKETLGSIYADILNQGVEADLITITSTYDPTNMEYTINLMVRDLGLNEFNSIKSKLEEVKRALQ